jgi:hypothetical protein
MLHLIEQQNILKISVTVLYQTYFNNYICKSLFIQKTFSFLVYEVLNENVWNDINNTVTEYMENITQTIFQNSKRQRRSLQNRTQASKGEFNK